MKKIIAFIILSFAALSTYAHGGGNVEHSDFFKTMQPGDKAAVLMVHFGTTHAGTRAATIDALNAQAKAAFPELEVREAYTSRIVIRRLGQQEIVKLNPEEALAKLRADGYTHLLIQPSTVIDGVELESLHRNVEVYTGKFKEVRIGAPLLYSPDDYAQVIDILTPGSDPQTAYVWVGHGTYDATTAQYAMLDYMLKNNGHPNFFVGTIEGYPEYGDMLRQLQASGLKKVVLVPFMFVAGEHAKNDIAGEWKDALAEVGYEVEVRMTGLGENPAIRDLYISHLRFLTGHRRVGIMEKKAEYQVTGEVRHHHH